MSSRRQRSVPLGGRYRQVPLYNGNRKNTVEIRWVKCVAYVRIYNAINSEQPAAMAYLFPLLVVLLASPAQEPRFWLSLTVLITHSLGLVDCADDVFWVSSDRSNCMALDALELLSRCPLHRMDPSLRGRTLFQHGLFSRMQSPRWVVGTVWGCSRGNPAWNEL